MNGARISKICVLTYQTSLRHPKNTIFTAALSYTFNFSFTVSEGNISPFSNTSTLRAERFGDRIPVEARFSAPVHTGFGAHPAS